MTSGCNQNNEKTVEKEKLPNILKVALNVDGCQKHLVSKPTTGLKTLILDKISKWKQRQDNGFNQSSHHFRLHHQHHCKYQRHHTFTFYTIVWTCTIKLMNIYHNGRLKQHHRTTGIGHSFSGLVSCRYIQDIICVLFKKL